MSKRKGERDKIERGGNKTKKKKEVFFCLFFLFSKEEFIELSVRKFFRVLSFSELLAMNGKSWNR